MCVENSVGFFFYLITCGTGENSKAFPASRPNIKITIIPAGGRAKSASSFSWKNFQYIDGSLGFEWVRRWFSNLGVRKVGEKEQFIHFLFLLVPEQEISQLPFSPPLPLRDILRPETKTSTFELFFSEKKTRIHAYFPQMRRRIMLDDVRSVLFSFC